jgi:hypothetical protein
VGPDSSVGIATSYGLDGPCRSQWPSGLRRGSAAIAWWGCGFEYRRGHGCLCCKYRLQDNTKIKPGQIGPAAHSDSYTIGYWVPFPGVKRPGRGVNHSTSSSTEVKERVDLYVYAPSGPSWPVLGRALPLHGMSLFMFSFPVLPSVPKQLP